MQASKLGKQRPNSLHVAHPPSVLAQCLRPTTQRASKIVSTASHRSLSRFPWVRICSSVIVLPVLASCTQRRHLTHPHSPLASRRVRAKESTTLPALPLQAATAVAITLLKQGAGSTTAKIVDFMRNHVPYYAAKPRANLMVRSQLLRRSLPRHRAAVRFPCLWSTLTSPCLSCLVCARGAGLCSGHTARQPPLPSFIQGQSHAVDVPEERGWGTQQGRYACTTVVGSCRKEKEFAWRDTSHQAAQVLVSAV